MVKTRILHFNLKQISDSGQCFRMSRIASDNEEYDKYLIISKDKELIIEDAGDNEFIFSCDETEFKEFWEEYFDLKTDYDAVDKMIDPGDEFLIRCADFGKGLRIIRQDPFEMLITFIISQRKNIPAIKACVEALCVACNKPLAAMNDKQGIRFAFPKAEDIMSLSDDELKACSLGYRVPYVKEAARMVTKGEIDLEALKSASDDDLLSELLRIHGVGIKVASCVMLFGYHRLEAFPVDVWIQRVLERHYPKGFPYESYKGYSGILQQYLFYYIRETSRKK
ncbi:MAG: hypothetical protein LBQ95_06560 [Lachnospiraceae bacterium]|nr:hypothetical protein [Lachnospiraceae bacterium]